MDKQGERHAGPRPVIRSRMTGIPCRPAALDPGSGPACFEAWLGKKSFAQAARFNGLAVLYLRSDPAWSRRAELQKERIDRKIKGK